MASIVYNKGERAFIDGFLGGQSSYGSPQLIPAAGGAWGLGLGTKVGGVGTGTKSNGIATIAEVGTSTASGYGRQSITRDQTATGWPASSLVGSNYQSTAPQATFSFTGAPVPNGATLWFLAGKTTINEDNALFGSDLAATRTFGLGDSERVTITFAQS